MLVSILFLPSPFFLGQETEEKHQVRIRKDYADLKKEEIKETAKLGSIVHKYTVIPFHFRLTEYNDRS